MADDDTAIPFLATTTNTITKINDESNTSQQQTTTMDECIKHICTEVGIPNKSRLKLSQQYNINTAADLLNIQQRILNKELDDLREDIRENLLIVSEWMVNNPNVNVIEVFDEDLFTKLFKERRWAEEYICTTLGMLCILCATFHIAYVHMIYVQYDMLLLYLVCDMCI